MSNYCLHTEPRESTRNHPGTARAPGRLAAQRQAKNIRPMIAVTWAAAYRKAAQRIRAALRGTACASRSREEPADTMSRAAPLPLLT